VVAGLLEFKNDLVFLQGFLLQFLDFFSIEEDLFTDIVAAESCTGFFDAIVKTLN